MVFWAPASKAVGAKKQRMLGSLVLAEQAVKVDDAQALPVLLKVRVGGGEMPGGRVRVYMCVWVCGKGGGEEGVFHTRRRLMTRRPCQC